MITLADINNTLLKQNSTLEGVGNIMQKILDQDLDSKKKSEQERLKQEEARRESRRQQQVTQPQTVGSSFKLGAAEASGMGGLSRLATAAVGGLFGGEAVQLAGSALALGAAKLLGRSLVAGPVALLVATFGEGVIEKFFNSIDPNDLVLNDSVKSTLTKSLSDALTAGVVGLVFGKKAGIAAFVGTLLGDAINGALSEDTRKKTVEAFGISTGLKTEDFVTYGSIIASFFGPSLISSAIAQQLTGSPSGATVGRDAKTGKFVKLKPSLATSFRSSFIPRLGWAVVLAGIGSVLANTIAEYTGSEEMGNIANWGAHGVALGAMFGPKGAIVGAVVGLAIGAGGILLETLIDWRNSNFKKIEKDIRNNLDEADKLLADGKTSEAISKLKAASGESTRAGMVDMLNSANLGSQAAEKLLGAARKMGDISLSIGAAEKLFNTAIADETLSDGERTKKIIMAVRAQSILTGDPFDIAFDTLLSKVGPGYKNLQTARGIRGSILDKLSQTGMEYGQGIKLPTIQNTSRMKAIFGPSREEQLSILTQEAVKKLLPPINIVDASSNVGPTSISSIAPGSSRPSVPKTRNDFTFYGAQ